MKSTASFALTAIMFVATTYAQAAILNAGDNLSITAGVVELDQAGYQTNVSSGSWFAMDSNGDSNVDPTEKVALSQGTDGIVIGASNTALGAIDASWSFLGTTGYHFVSTAISGGTSGLDMSGWRANFNYGNIINMGSGTAWTPLNAVAAGMADGPYANSTAKFSWSGVYGTSYTLDYTTTLQGSGFDGVLYAVHLTGVAGMVPEASTSTMMLAGLGLVGIMTRGRKKQ